MSHALYYSPAPALNPARTFNWPSLLLIAILHLGLAWGLWHAGMRMLRAPMHEVLEVRFIVPPSSTPNTRVARLPARFLSRPNSTSMALPDLPDSAVHESPSPELPLSISNPLIPDNPVHADSSTPVSAHPSSAIRQVSSVEYLSPPAPQYPSLSRRLREQGRVVLQVRVTPEGWAGQVEILHSSGSPRLDDAARQAMLRARFKPYMENGQALAVLAQASIVFSLES